MLRARRAASIPRRRYAGLMPIVSTRTMSGRFQPIRYGMKFSTFGVSSLPVAQKPQTSQWWQAYKSIDPTTDPPLDAPLDFYSLLLAFSGLEGAGPKLDPGTFADGMFRIRLLSDSPLVPSFFYRATDYGGIKDTQEVWGDPKAIAPDGQPGHYQSVDGGHRYLLGQWPTTPTAVFDPRCLPLGSCGAPNAP